MSLYRRRSKLAGLKLYIQAALERISVGLAKWMYLVGIYSRLASGSNIILDASIII